MASPTHSIPLWRRRGLVITSALAAAPWSWFVVRGWAPILDLVAIGLPLVTGTAAAGWLVALMLRRSRMTAIGLASTAIFGLVSIVGPWTPQRGPAPTDPVELVSFNTGHRWDVEPSGVALTAMDPDVLVLVELSWRQHERVQGAFVHHTISETVVPGAEPFYPQAGVYSQWPVQQLEIPDGFPGLRVSVEHPRHPFVVYALHVAKPGFFPEGYATTFHGHHDAITTALDLARGETLPVVLAGDFNSSDRGNDYARLDRRFRDVMRSGWAGPTSRKAVRGWWALLLRIDHIFVSDDWCGAASARVEIPQADHLAVRATVGPCPD